MQEAIDIMKKHMSEITTECIEEELSLETCMQASIAMAFGAFFTMGTIEGLKQAEMDTRLEEMLHAARDVSTTLLKEQSLV